MTIRSVNRLRILKSKSSKTWWTKVFFHFMKCKLFFKNILFGMINFRRWHFHACVHLWVPPLPLLVIQRWSCLKSISIAFEPANRIANQVKVSFEGKMDTHRETHTHTHHLKHTHKRPLIPMFYRMYFIHCHSTFRVQSLFLAQWRDIFLLNQRVW